MHRFILESQPGIKGERTLREHNWDVAEWCRMGSFRKDKRSSALGQERVYRFHPVFLTASQQRTVCSKVASDRYLINPSCTSLAIMHQWTCCKNCKLKHHHKYLKHKEAHLKFCPFASISEKKNNGIKKQCWHSICQYTLELSLR